MILITGGTGYIGSHIALALKNAGRDIIVYDWGKNNEYVLRNHGIITIYGDCADKGDMNRVFQNCGIKHIIHLAGYKDVGESVKKPNKYFHNNINATTTVLKVAKEHYVNNIIFSSTCAVYGDCEGGDEQTPYNPKSPYALSKKICEEIIINSGMNYSILRYFNPIGEHNGLRDFSVDSIQNKLKQSPFYIYGNDYDTPDGTAIRDYIDIDKLVDAHIQALNWENQIVNIGSGEPKSVLEMAKDAGAKYEFAGRRDGDIAKIWANIEKWKKLHG